MNISTDTKFFVWEWGIPGNWIPVFHTERPDMSGRGEGVRTVVRRFGLREVPSSTTLDEAIKLSSKPNHDPWDR